MKNEMTEPAPSMMSSFGQKMGKVQSAFNEALKSIMGTFLKSVESFSIDSMTFCNGNDFEKLSYTEKDGKLRKLLLIFIFTVSMSLTFSGTTSHSIKSQVAAADTMQSYRVVTINAPQVKALPPSYVIQFTAEEKRLFELLIMDEARGEDELTQRAVAEVVMNRVTGPYYGTNLKDIIMQPDAFSGITNGSVYQQVPTEQAKRVVDEALRGTKSGVINETTYWFCNPKTASSQWAPNHRNLVRVVGSLSFYN